MGSLKEIKVRIASIRSTQKITAAMKMVSSAKFHHAQTQTEHTLTYANKLSAILNGLLSAECDLDSPYTEQRKVSKVAIAVFASSTGLCGTFNANIWKELSATIQTYKNQQIEVRLYPIGKKIADELHKAGYSFDTDFITIGEKPSYESAVSLANRLMELFVTGKADRVELLYHHFKNMATQVVTHKTYLPLSLSDTEAAETATDYILEPSAEELRNRLFPKLLNLTIYTILLDTSTAEALLRGECCRAVGKPGDRDSGHVETGIVREAISVAGMGAGGKYLVSQVKAMRSEIFNTSLSAEGRAVLLYHVEKMNEESANALLKVMEEPPEGVLFLLTADSLASVLPTIRSRCVSFAVAPVSPEQCARYCAAQGVDKKTAALYSELFDGHIGTVLAAAQDEARTAQVEKALQLAKAAADRDSYAAACLLAAYEKDKAGAAALLTDFRAVAAAGLRQSPHAPVQGIAAQRALRLAEAAIQRLGAQVNPKIVLSVFAAKFRAL